MRRMHLVLIAALLLITAPRAIACGDYNPTLSAAMRALSDDPRQSVAGIARLRAMGYAGLDALMQLQPNTSDTAALARFDRLLDAVAAQKDARFAGLFWYTDMEQAQAVARRESKPILSLRLLGDLTDDRSCANSRFFRAVLYPDPSVNALLREKFVLHWETVRPVPRITIDFGDGRKIERTITGNSAHYILDADGRVIDAVPGLYGPAAFVAALQTALVAVPLSDDALRMHHTRRLDLLHGTWRADLAAMRANEPRADAVPVPNNQKNAAAADRLAIGKSAGERPVLRLIEPQQFLALERTTTEAAAWDKLAQRHHATLSDRSLALIRHQNPTLGDDELHAMTRRLEAGLALDTVRNEYLLHAQIHRWLAEAQAPVAVAAFNDRVYDELFLMPPTDPWLGLSPIDAYAALRDNGLTAQAAQR